MIRPVRLSIALFAFLLAVPAVFGQGKDHALGNINWQQGPRLANLGGMAQIQVPKGYMFIEKGETAKFMQMTQNPLTGHEMGVVAPENGDWFIVFEFEDVGYVKDDEKNSIDANAILTNLRQGTEASNKERQRRGWATMQIVGWEQPPFYDDQTKHLTWALRGRSEGEDVINYNSRILGRKGVMSANLVIEPQLLAVTLPTYKNLLTGFNYTPGNRYAEFREGDRVAAYGLTALIAGGAAAVAAKTGILAKLGKGIVYIVVAVVGGIAALFKRLFGGRATASE